MRKYVLAVILTSVFALGAAFTGYGGEWINMEYGFERWQPDNGEIAENCWIQDAGSWYYVDSGGYKHCGWAIVDGKYYYLGDDGRLWTNTVTPDGYRVGADGARAVVKRKKENQKAREAFYRQLAACGEEDNYFALIDVDQDGIDEMATCSVGGFWRGATYYAYVDGKLVDEYIWGGDGLNYRIDIKALIVDRASQGNGSFDVTMLNNGKWNTEGVNITRWDVLDYFGPQLSYEEFAHSFTPPDSANLTYADYQEQRAQLQALNDKYDLTTQKSTYNFETFENTAANRLKLLGDTR